MKRFGPAALAALLGVACGGDSAPPGPWVEADGHRWRDLNPAGDGGLARLDAPDLGIGFVYDVDVEARLANRVLAEGQGVAIGDVDGDGLADLFFAGFGVPSALYRNAGGWRFEDITETSGLDLGGALVRGAVLVDVDGDGALDLLASVHGAPARLFPGDGRGGFGSATELGGDAASTTLTLADIDGDADLDLYVASYKLRQVDDLFPPAALDINRLRAGPGGELVIPPELAELYAEHYEVDFDGRFVRRWELGEPDELFRNEGEGRFVPIPLSLAFRTSEGGPREGPARDWGLAARFVDWDADGDPDLYVANDFNSPDGIWSGQGDGTFRAVSPLAVRTTSLSSMAVDAADVDRDGDLDLVTTDMLARLPPDRLVQMPSFEAEPDPPGVIETRIQVNRNTVQLNRGDGTFAEAAWELGLAASDWTWGAIFLDADLDGWEDLLVTTGHVWDQLDGDANARVSPGMPAPQALSLFPTLRQPNAAFRGGPGGRFEDVTESWAWGAEADISHGVAAGDLDADGDLDIVVTRFGDPPVLFRNEAPAPRVLVRLRGPAANTSGIGARVRLAGHHVGEQIDEVAAGGTYLSSSEPALAFAAADSAMTITVEWPDGSVSRVEEVRANREYEVRHAGGVPRDSAVRPEPEPHFEDLSSALGHRHVESPFDDRERQPLLPHSLSRLGPGITWFDAEGDGYADLFIGSGRGGSPSWIPNRGGAFETARAVTAASASDVTALLPQPDAEAWRLLIGVSAYEAMSPDEAAATPAAVSVRLGRGPGAGTPVPIAGSVPARPSGSPPVATGPMAQADVDGDGDLDLFVGGRVIPALYPVPTTSRLLLAEGEGWIENETAPFESLGLVSGAVFTDVDLDGDPDLALATEWGGLRLFRNDGGRFVEATEEVGLAGLTGRWNGITSGDFDGDGRPDLVATGWGTNLEVSPPYALVHGDFNRDGLYDVIEAAPGGAGWVPLRAKRELERPSTSGQPRLPSLARTSHAEYRTATLTDLLPTIDPGLRSEVRELRHLVLLNRPSGFEAAPLPDEAQRAPAFGVAAGDLDGDGFEDLVLSQNFYAGRPGLPRYDAGRGLWLRGDGAGGFTAPAGSGLAVYGDARGVALADYDRDGRVDVAFGVNGGETRLYRNRGARPGLRVRLEGPPANPEAVGGRIRIEYADGRRGPAREVRSGAGYWSRDEGPVTLGLAGTPARVRVSWPGGAETFIEVPPGASEVIAAAPGR